VIINTRKNAEMSIAAVDTDVDDHPRTPKERPASAPGTKIEVTTAQLSAGETSSPSPSPRASYHRPQSSKAMTWQSENSDGQLIVRGHSPLSLQRMLKGGRKSPFKEGV
jgi:hypothetical protein